MEVPRKDHTNHPESHWARSKLWACVSEGQERASGVGVTAGLTGAKRKGDSAVFSLKRCFWYFWKTGNSWEIVRKLRRVSRKIQESLEFAILICDIFHFERGKKSIFFKSEIHKMSKWNVNKICCFIPIFCWNKWIQIKCIFMKHLIWIQLHI